jgi:hypothetical protein
VRSLILLATLAAGGCNSTNHSTVAAPLVPALDGGFPLVPALEGGLPPVIDASYADAAITKDRKQFKCGKVTGAVTADLVCDRVFPDFDWVSTPPYYSQVEISARLAPGAVGLTLPDGSLASVGVQVVAPRAMAPLTETCASLPSLPPTVWVAFHSTVDVWAAGCNSPSDMITGSSFELAITSVGTLTSDSLGANPVDASAATFDWATSKQEVISNTFHGTFKATLVAQDRDPVYVSMEF